MDSCGKYLYCILRAPADPVFEGVQGIGGWDAPIHSICHNGLAVVASDSPTRDFPTTRANMLAHQRVQERVMEKHTILPVRFGAVTSPTSASQQIETLLEKRGKEFHRLLAEMEGKTEMGLKVRWKDQRELYEEIVSEDPAIRKLRDTLAGRPAEVVRFQGVQLGRMVKEALERKRSGQARDVVATLRPIACRVAEDETYGDAMVANLAFLVERGREAEFDVGVSRLDEELRHRVLFKYVGPVPPYNFVNITVNWNEL